MPTLTGLRFRAEIIRDVLTLPYQDLVAYPVAGLGIFDIVGKLIPGLPEVPPELLSARHPEEGKQRVTESSEPEVSRMLYMLTRLLEATCVVEVGVFRGFTTQFLAAAVAPNYGTLHLIDMNRAALHEATSMASAYPGCRVECHTGNSSDPTIAAEVAGSCDFIFLDADHSEAGVTSELELWFPKLRPGGILAVHDSVNIRGVCRAVNRFGNKHPGLTLATSRGSGVTFFLASTSGERV
jgi:predicted O-methyltransferase YrrM